MSNHKTNFKNKLTKDIDSAMNILFITDVRLLASLVEYCQKVLIFCWVFWTLSTLIVQLMKINLRLFVQVRNELGSTQKLCEDTLHTSINNFLRFLVQLDQECSLGRRDLREMLWSTQFFALVNQGIDLSDVNEFIPLLFG